MHEAEVNARHFFLLSQEVAFLLLYGLNRILFCLFLNNAMMLVWCLFLCFCTFAFSYII